MRRILPEPNQKGFTLIELLAVMVILGILLSVATKKYINISIVANFRALEAGIGEMNSRETLTWTNEMFATRATIDDNNVWAAMNTNLGTDYVWTAGPLITGGTLSFGGQTVALTRTAATANGAGHWSGP